MTCMVSGCAHAQQMVWQLFNAVEKGFAVSGDTDAAFLEGTPNQSLSLMLMLDVRYRGQR